MAKSTFFCKIASERLNFHRKKSFFEIVAPERAKRFFCDSLLVEKRVTFDGPRMKVKIEIFKIKK